MLRGGVGWDHQLLSSTGGFPGCTPLSEQSPTDHGRTGLIQLSLGRVRAVPPASVNSRTMSGKVKEDANRTPECCHTCSPTALLPRSLGYGLVSRSRDPGLGTKQG